MRYALNNGVTVTLVPRVGVRVEDDVRNRFSFTQFAATPTFTCSVTPVPSGGDDDTRALHVTGCNIELVGPTRDVEALYLDLSLAHETYCEYARQKANASDAHTQLAAEFGARVAGGASKRAREQLAAALAK